MHQALDYDAPICGMYVIGRYGLMAKLALYLSPVTVQVFVQDRDSFIDLDRWLQFLAPAVSSITSSAAGFGFNIGGGPRHVGHFG